MTKMHELISFCLIAILSFMMLSCHLSASPPKENSIENNKIGSRSNKNINTDTISEVDTVSHEERIASIDSVPLIDTVPHTDTVPHFQLFDYAHFNLHETKIPYTAAFVGNRLILYKFYDKIYMEYPDSKGLRLKGALCPAQTFSDQWIAYGQAREFTRYNLFTQEFHNYIISTEIEDYITGCRAVKPHKNIFTFMIARINPYKGYPDKGSTRILKTFDFSNEKPGLIASISIDTIDINDNGEPFIVHDSTIFILKEKEHTIRAFDFMLKPARHPFAVAFNKFHSNLTSINAIKIHPDLPFAIVGDIFVSTLSWKDNHYELIPFIQVKKGWYVKDFSFSQDGKLAVWRSVKGKYPQEGASEFWVAEVNEKIPGFIGKPHHLGSTVKFKSNPVTTAWASNPYTYIVSETNGLFWWHIDTLEFSNSGFSVQRFTKDTSEIISKAKQEPSGSFVKSMKWDRKIVHRNDTVHIDAAFKNPITDDKEVLIVIYEYGTYCYHEPVTRIGAKTKNNQVHATWIFNYENTLDIYMKEEVQGYGRNYSIPQYFFVLYSEGKTVGEQQESGLLTFKDTVHLSLVDRYSAVPYNPFRLTLADGSVIDGKLNQNGKIVIPDISPGPYHVEYFDE